MIRASFLSRVDRIVLEHCYEHVDYLSLHRYYSYDPESVKEQYFLAIYSRGSTLYSLDLHSLLIQYVQQTM